MKFVRCIMKNKNAAINRETKILKLLLSNLWSQGKVLMSDYVFRF